MKVNLCILHCFRSSTRSCSIVTAFPSAICYSKTARSPLQWNTVLPLDILQQTHCFMNVNARNFYRELKGRKRRQETGEFLHNIWKKMMYIPFESHARRAEPRAVHARPKTGAPKFSKPWTATRVGRRQAEAAQDVNPTREEGETRRRRQPAERSKLGWPSRAITVQTKLYPLTPLLPFSTTAQQTFMYWHTTG